MTPNDLIETMYPLPGGRGHMNSFTKIWGHRAYKILSLTNWCININAKLKFSDSLNVSR